MDNKLIKKVLLITFITLIPSFLIYLPFILNLKQFLFLTIREPGIYNIFKNWDGPHYLMVARTFYDLNDINSRIFIAIDPKYYTAHFPLYPILIRLLSSFISPLYAGLFINLFFGVSLNLLFYKIAEKYTKHPLWLTFAFTVFPGRFLIVRSIIAPDTLMVFLILLSLYLWENRSTLKSSIFGSLAMITKIQALFLFPAFLLTLIEEKLSKHPGMLSKIASYHPGMKSGQNLLKNLSLISLIPITLLALCYFYYLRVGDFWAILTAEKSVNLFFYYPFAQFNAAGSWAGTAWLEDVVFYFLAMFILAASLYKAKERSWFYFTLSYSIFLVFIPQRDITRFSFPLLPLFLLHFEKFFTSKIFKIGLIICLPAIYFYIINFMLINQAPIADWSKLLN